MKTRQEEVKVESNFTGTDVYVTLDTESQPHLMSLFTDMYENRIEAVAREYMANALDAHSSVGQTRPIEVYLPTALMPVFRVKDCGPGLDKQDIIDVISKYGASTKRDTDDQDGCLGLGCKSALTYSTQFTYTGIKDGVKTIVLTTRDEDNRVKMTVKDPIPTDEPNGVEVSVPVKPGDADKFAEACKKLMQYWPEGVALLNGQEVPKIERTQVITDDLFLWCHDALHLNDGRHNGYRRQDYAPRNLILVMGNIPYRVTDEQLKDAMGERSWQIPDWHTMVAYIPMGSVHFQPSRESLRDTTRTMDTIKSVLQTYEDNVVASMEREVNLCETKHEALEKSIRLGQTFRGFPTPKYKGEQIPEDFEYEGTVWWLSSIRYYLEAQSGYGTAPSEHFGGGYRHGQNRDKSKSSADWYNMHNGIYVEGFDITKWTRRHLDKMVGVLKERGIWPSKSDMNGGISSRLVASSITSSGGCLRSDSTEWTQVARKPLVIFENMPDEVKEWVDPQWIIQFEDIRNFKLPKKDNGGDGGRKYAGFYETHRGAQYDGDALLDLEKRGLLYHVHSRRVRDMSEYYTAAIKTGIPMRHYQNYMDHINKDAVIICVSTNRIDKYERLFPKSKKLLGFITKEMEGIKKEMGARITGYMTLQDKTGILLIRDMPTSQVHDPEIKAVTKLMSDKQIKQKVIEYSAKLNLLAQIERGFKANIWDQSISDRYDTVLKQYPLLKLLGERAGGVYPDTTEMKHLVTYVNAIFDGRKE